MPELTQSFLRLDSTLQELPLHKTGVDVEHPVATLVQIFEADPVLPGVLLNRRGQFAGVISRQQFSESLNRPQGLDFFLQEPIHLLHQCIRTNTLILSGDTSIRVAARSALQRSPDALHEPIVVHLQPNQYFLLDHHQLLLAQLHLLELAMMNLHQSQQALAEEKELAQTTLHSIGDAVITTDAAGRVKSLNPVAEKLTGWRLSAAEGMPLSEVFRIANKITYEPMIPASEAVAEGGGRKVGTKHTLLIAQDGQEYAIDKSAAPICTRDGKLMGAVLVFRDITQQLALNHQLSWQASHDALTQLVNRQEFERQLESVCLSAQTSKQVHTLCCMDLDRFKLVNDTCGHLAGDELLRQVSMLLQQGVRKTDTLARLGGDEFGLLLHQCPPEKGLAVAQSLCQSIQDFRFVWQDKTFVIGVSIGITIIDGKTPSFTSALSEADTACYWAKNQGRNQVQVYEPSGDKSATPSGTPWVYQITKALEEDRFQLFYQSIAPTQATNSLCEHYEVLLRLWDETDTLVSPGVFMPAAERYSLMPAIDRWVIRNVFASQGAYYRQVWQRCLQNQACDCLYTINLSGASLNEESLVEFIQTQLTLHQIPPQLICFEITETVAIANLSKTARLIQDLKQLGCHFALDDFGSGMSSFGYLKNLPVDYLKIDGSFIREIVDDAVAQAMVEAINRIGQVMGIKTIAESVENEAILAKMRAIGVDYVQGYGVARPSPLSHPAFSSRLGEFLSPMEVQLGK